MFRLHLPPNPPFRRSPDLVYAGHEKPPAAVLAGLGLQHAATALALIAYVLATAQIAGLSGEATRSMVTATILGMALATFFQSWGGRLGSGLLLVHMPDPLLLLLSGMVAAQYGTDGLVTVGLVNGAVGLVAAYIVPHLRALLPPTVVGVVVCIAGLSLIAPSLTHTAGLDRPGGPDGADALIGATTLLVIMALSIWGTKRGKLFAVFAGLATGIVLAALLGRLHGLQALASTPTFGLPHVQLPDFAMDPGLLAAIGLLALMAQLDTFGCAVIMHKMEDADWRRPNMRVVSGGMRAQALGNLLASWLGAYPTAASSANIALSYISRSTSRWIGLTTAALLAIFAFLPQVALALTLIPTPVIGAVEIYAAVYLVVSGIELIASRALDARGIFTVGLSFVAGLGVMFLPGLADLAPASVQFLLKNGIIMGGLSAIALNMLFRIGVSQRGSLMLDNTIDVPVSRQITDFVESRGATWSARREAIRRAASAALEAAEAIQAAGGGRRLTEVRGRFDEFNLDIELLHSGPVLVLDALSGNVRADLLDIDDDAFDEALNQTLIDVSHVLLRRLADRLTTGVRNGGAYLRLHFDH